MEGKEKLQVVVFDQTPEKSIIPWMNLPELNVVSFSGTKVEMPEILKFKAKHPGCEVVP